MVSSKKLPTDPDQHLFKIPNTDQNLLRLAAIYGANGAGKSNLVKALSLARMMILEGSSLGEKLKYEPFRLDPTWVVKPSGFAFKFLVEKNIFDYGFTYTHEEIAEEWLYVERGAKRKVVFERTSKTEGGVEVVIGAKVKGEIPDKILALGKVGARPNQLFLTEVRNTGDRETQGELLSDVLKWFEEEIQIIHSDSYLKSLTKLLSDVGGFSKFSGAFLKGADTGVSNLVLEHTHFSNEFVPKELLDELKQELSDKNQVVKKIGPDMDLVLDKQYPERIELRQTMSVHNNVHNEEVKFSLSDESDGTKRLIELLPALYHLGQTGGIYIIDELERSMHPLLAKKFVEYFIMGCKKKKRQLIFTTHESHLLAIDLMRRDEIWFVEKDKQASSQLYSLSEFKPRKDLRLERGYPGGRFGAIPFLASLDHVLDLDNCD